MIILVLHKLEQNRAKGTLVTPEWKSAPFWPEVWDEFYFKSFVKHFKSFTDYNVTHKGKRQNGIFGRPTQNFNFIALCIEY